MAAGQKEGDWATLVVGKSVDLSGPPATGAAYGLAALPPLPPEAQRCALTAEESMKIRFGGPPAEANVSKTSIQTPFELARALNQGVGIEQDVEEGHMWLCAAAAQSHEEAEMIAYELDLTCD